MVKEYTATYISMQENLKNYDKISLLKRLKEASVDEAKSLLVTGEFILDQEAITMFDESPIGLILNEGFLDTIAKKAGEAIDPELVGAVKGVTKAGIQAAKEKVKGVDVASITKDLEAVKAELEKSMNPTVMDRLLLQLQGFATSYPAGAGLSAVAVAALIATAAYKLHKYYLSAAAKACGGKSGPAKKMCMSQYAQKAKQAQIAALQKGVKGCKAAKNPAKCSQQLTKKIYSLKRKM